MKISSLTSFLSYPFSVLAYAENLKSPLLDGYEKMETDCSEWAEIHVPGHIQLQGYDRPQYVNVQYPWDGREEIAP